MASNSAKKLSTHGVCYKVIPNQEPNLSKDLLPAYASMRLRVSFHNPPDPHDLLNWPDLTGLSGLYAVGNQHENSKWYISHGQMYSHTFPEWII